MATTSKRSFTLRITTINGELRTKVDDPIDVEAGTLAEVEQGIQQQLWSSGALREGHEVRLDGIFDAVDEDWRASPSELADFPTRAHLRVRIYSQDGETPSNATSINEMFEDTKNRKAEQDIKPVHMPNAFDPNTILGCDPVHFQMVMQNMCPALPAQMHIEGCRPSSDPSGPPVTTPCSRPSRRSL